MRENAAPVEWWWSKIGLLKVVKKVFKRVCRKRTDKEQTKGHPQPFESPFDSLVNRYTSSLVPQACMGPELLRRGRW